MLNEMHYRAAQRIDCYLYIFRNKGNGLTLSPHVTTEFSRVQCKKSTLNKVDTEFHSQIIPGELRQLCDKRLGHIRLRQDQGMLQAAPPQLVNTKVRNYAHEAGEQAEGGAAAEMGLR
jgi:hypothetical protein